MDKNGQSQTNIDKVGQKWTKSNKNETKMNKGGQKQTKINKAEIKWLDDKVRQK